jgi:hypothetical protein
MKSVTAMFELSNVGWGKLKEGHHLKNTGVGWRIILKHKLKKWNVKSLGQAVAPWKHGSLSSGSLK